MDKKEMSQFDELGRAITIFAASSPMKCDLRETLFNSSLMRFSTAFTPSQQFQIVGFKVHALFLNFRHGYFRKHGAVVYDTDSVRDFG